MPPTDKLFKILFSARVPGTASLSHKVTADEGRKYHDAAAALVAEAGLLVYGWNLDREDIPAGSIAYHPIFGSIRYGYSWWQASTMELMDNLKAAEASDAIAAHLIHVDSHGGEAFGLHEAFELIRSLKKPVYAVVESMAASAGYYLVAGADKIFTTSKFSQVGSIGVMMTYIDDEEWMKAHGYKEIELYSNFSPLKNQAWRDLHDGKTDAFIEKYIDPLAKCFIEDVKSSRKGIAEDSDALKGEMYLAEEAQQIGLIDGVKSFDDVLAQLAKKIEPAAPASPSRNLNTLNF